MSYLGIYNSQDLDAASYSINSFQDTENLEDLNRSNKNVSDKSITTKLTKNRNKKKTIKKTLTDTSSTLSEFPTNLSYVSRKRNGKGRHLIKIRICELNPGIKHGNSDDSICVNAQYVVEDRHDEIMDCAESLVRKIVNKISESDSFHI